MSYSPPPLTAARTRKTRLEADYIELQSNIARGEVLHRAKLSAALASLVESVWKIIEATRLTAEEKSEIAQNLQQIPIVLSWAYRDQRRSLAKSESRPDDGDGG